MITKDMSRRAFLTRSTMIGCGAAASPLLTPVSFAAAPFDKRLVVIVLRGAMDGVDAVRPVGDQDFARLRPGLIRRSANHSDLDGYFALHPSLSALRPLWQQGELGFVHAVSTPYRDKRSHFDGQDHLEAGLAGISAEGVRDGWLNRALAQVPGVETETAFALGRGEMLLTTGKAQVSRWSPDADLMMSSQARRLLEMIVHDDPLFRDAFEQALYLSDTDGDPVEFFGEHKDIVRIFRKDRKANKGVGGQLGIAAYAAQKLRGDTRVAAFSINGWDTHARQTQVLQKGFERLAETILTLKKGMGTHAWSQTTVLTITEFGRTIRENGTGGTDHGTGGLMFLAGGAVRGGKVHGDWPGIAEADLYDRRDLMPTGDVRAYAAWALRAALGLDRSALETQVFPGLDMGQDPKIIL